VRPAVGFRRNAFLTALLGALVISLAVASVGHAASAPPSGLRAVLVADGYSYLGSGADCAPLRERVYCSGHARFKRARIALLMKYGKPELAATGLNVYPAQRLSLERKLDPSGSLRILRTDVWRNYLIVTLGWAISQSGPRGGR
jgi:hypothetical protein